MCPRVYTKVDRGTVRGVPLKREGLQEHSVLRKNTALWPSQGLNPDRSLPRLPHSPLRHVYSLKSEKNYFNWIDIIVNYNIGSKFV